MKNKDILSDDNDNIAYHPQVLSEQYGYRFLFNNKLIHPDFIFTDSEPNSEPDESEEDFNENAVCDE